jgi:hypothetical protein
MDERSAELFADPCTLAITPPLTVEDVLAGLGAEDEAHAAALLSGWVGAPGRANLEVRRLPGGLGALRLGVVVQHPLVKFIERHVELRAGGLHVFNHDLYLLGPQAGVGTRLFAWQVYHLTRAGLPATLGTRALGAVDTADQNGGYTWAVLGYEARIPATAPPRPANLASAKTLNELMQLPGGRAWWKANYRPFRGRFDLAEGSASRRLLDAYCAERGINVCPQ